MEIKPLDISFDLEKPSLDKKPQNVIEEFGKLLQQEIARVDALQKKAADATKKLTTGEIKDIHQVMIATEEAAIALQLTMQVRNKIIEAYQEIMRMQL